MDQGSALVATPDSAHGGKVRPLGYDVGSEKIAACAASSACSCLISGEVGTAAFGFEN